MSINHSPKIVLLGISLFLFLLAGCGFGLLNTNLGSERISSAYKVQIKIETTSNSLPFSQITDKIVNVIPQKIEIRSFGDLFFTSAYLSKGLYQVLPFGFLKPWPEKAEVYFPAGRSGVNSGIPHSASVMITDVGIGFEDIVSLSQGQLYAIHQEGELYEVLPQGVKALSQPMNYFTIPPIPDERKNKSIWTSITTVHSSELRLTKNDLDNIYILNRTFSSIWKKKGDVISPVFQNPLKYEYKTTPPIFEGYIKLPVHVDGKETSIQMDDLAVDSNENMFVLDSQANKIYKISTDGTISTYAGTGEKGMKNGSALEATFSSPSALILSPKGTLFVADTDNHCIRQISKMGEVTTLAGSGKPGLGEWPEYAVSSPESLALDSLNKSLYVLTSYKDWKFILKIKMETL